jgi:tripartite-type tricarboxylate transporter receptor subunit TctC
LSVAAQTATKDTAFAQRMSALGLGPIGSTPDPLAGVQKADVAQWAKLVKVTGFQAD